MSETFEQAYDRIHNRTPAAGRQSSGGMIPQTFADAVEFELSKAMASGRQISRSDAAMKANKTFPALRERMVKAAN